MTDRARLTLDALVQQPAGAPLTPDQRDALIALLADHNSLRVRAHTLQQRVVSLESDLTLSRRRLDLAKARPHR